MRHGQLEHSSSARGCDALPPPSGVSFYCIDCSGICALRWARACPKQLAQKVFVDTRARRRLLCRRARIGGSCRVGCSSPLGQQARCSSWTRLVRFAVRIVAASLVLNKCKRRTCPACILCSQPIMSEMTLNGAPTSSASSTSLEWQVGRRPRMRQTSCE